MAESGLDQDIEMSEEMPGVVTASDKEDEEDATSGTEEEATSVEGPAQNTIDPYAYLKRDEFTSEIFKIEINNLPKRFGVGQLRKKLIALGLKPVKIKVLQTGNFAFVNFKCEDDRQRAMDKIEGHQWKGRIMKAKKAHAAADPLLKKRKQDAGNHGSSEGEPLPKAAKADSQPELPPLERLNQAVSPLWKMPYEEQLKTKEDEIHGFLKRLGREIQKNNKDPDMSDHLNKMFRQNKRLCCPMLPIKPSPILNDYRNKCEFTIGQSLDGIDKVVGFRLGRYKGGSVCVVEPDDCVIIPDRMKQCTKALQKFLQTQTSRPGFEPETKSGHWKMAVLRTNQKMEALMVVVFHPQRLTSEEIMKEKELLQQYFTTGDGADTPIKSLYFLVQSDRHDQAVDATYEHINGDKYLIEDLLEMKFRISPGAFFQVNTPAAEVMYRTIGDWCSVSPNTVLLDICCGTGTIGLTVAKRVKKVIGIEMCEEAVEDAKINATLNDVTNAEYHCSKAETILSSLLWRYSRDDVVAVVDPPRAGLHPDVIRAIRKNEFVKRLIYVSCKPTGALNNLLDVTRSESRRVRGSAFKLVKAVAVDLFPHTSHSELIMLFERIKDVTEAAFGGQKMTEATSGDQKETEVTSGEQKVTEVTSEGQKMTELTSGGQKVAEVTSDPPTASGCSSDDKPPQSIEIKTESGCSSDDKPPQSIEIKSESDTVDSKCT